MLPFLQGALTGAGFGVVLYKVGATRYSRVMGMLTLRDTKVMKFAFTTIGVASMLYGLAAAAGVAETLGLVPRVMPFLGPAHLVGGALFGLGMGVSGLCPGTCVAKVGGRGGAKKFAAPAAMVGLVVGVLLYAAFKDPLMNAGVIAVNQKPLTLHGVLGLPYA
ncbi:MAG TPA: YeeE/YedE thiosulfate transporter family protein, partial [Anaeromyxobacteraceae bacterium]